MARALVMKRTIVPLPERARYMARLQKRRVYYQSVGCNFWVFEEASLSGAFIEFTEAPSRDTLQAALAEQAGVSKRTVERLESGAVATQLPGFPRVCRTLGLLERFESLIPDAVPSPIEQLKQVRRKRQRASRQKPPAKPKNWTWGGAS